MKELIKLRDLTKEQWDNWVDNNCILKVECENCPACKVNCDSSEDENCWINNKDLYSDKFLDQEVEIDIPNILTKEEKEYLSNIIKPFRDTIVNIKKICDIYGDYECITICHIEKAHGLDSLTNHIFLPNFQHNSMYKGMELNKTYTLDELGLFQENTKITLTEFWNSKEKLAIHCDTKEKAKQLLKAFDKMGKTWSAGSKYLEYNYWNSYKQNTCYNNNNGYCSIDWCKEEDYKIYEFEDVIVED